MAKCNHNKAYRVDIGHAWHCTCLEKGCNAMWSEPKGPGAKKLKAKQEKKKDKKDKK